MLGAGEDAGGEVKDCGGKREGEDAGGEVKDCDGKREGEDAELEFGFVGEFTSHINCRAAT